jgi:hypothetical protein
MRYGIAVATRRCCRSLQTIMNAFILIHRSKLRGRFRNRKRNRPWFGSNHRAVAASVWLAKAVDVIGLADEPQTRLGILARDDPTERLGLISHLEKKPYVLLGEQKRSGQIVHAPRQIRDAWFLCDHIAKEASDEVSGVRPLLVMWIFTLIFVGLV